MKKKYIMPFLLCTALCLQACSVFPDGTINQAEEDISVAVDDHNISGRLNDAIDVNAKINIPDISEWYEVMLQARTANKERSDKTAAQLTDYLNLEMVGEEEGGGGARYKYTYNDGSYYSDGDYISYQTVDANIRNYNMYVSELNGDPYLNFPNQELEGFSLEKAKGIAQDVFAFFPDVSISVEPTKVYVLDAEHATAYQEATGSYTLKYYLSDGSKGKYTTEEEYEKYAEKITWEKADEVYYMVYDLMMENVPLSKKSMSDGSFYSRSHSAVVAVGREGIKEINIQGLYSNNIKNKLDKQLCTVTEALNTVASSYQYTKELSKQEIKEINFVYVPIASISSAQKEFSARPYWELVADVECTSEKDGVQDTYIKRKVYFVNAIDKRIYIGKD